MTKSFVPGNYCFDNKIHISEPHNYAHFTMRSGHITITAHYEMRRNKSFSFTKKKTNNRKILELFSNQYSINKIAIAIRRFVCVCFINIKIKYVFRSRIKSKNKNAKKNSFQPIATLCFINAQRRDSWKEQPTFFMVFFYWIYLCHISQRAIQFNDC